MQNNNKQNNKECYIVYGMHCAACLATVQNTINKTEGIVSGNVNLISKKMILEYDPEVLDDKKIKSLIAGIGYKALKASEVKEEKDPLQKTKRDLIVSLLFGIPLIIFVMGAMFHIPFFTDFAVMNNGLYYVIGQIIFIIPIIIFNFHYFTNGIKKLFKLHPNMDSLIAIGSLAALIYSIFNFINLYLIKKVGLTSHQIIHGFYFETAGMILMIVKLGKYFESKATSKANAALTKLLELMPLTCTKVNKDGTVEQVNSNDVEIGDIIFVKPGEKIPLDGVIINGNTSIDESIITGESMPVDKTIGDTVTIASVNKYGSIKFQVTSKLGNTWLDNIVNLVEEAANSKAKIERVADRISLYFVPSIILIALITFVMWLVINKDFSNAISSAISVLVIACPCSLGLATPTSIVVGMSVSATNNILFKDAESLENLGKVDTIIFDKTGTITKGEPIVESIKSYGILSNNELLQIVASIEQNSEHPLAVAIVNHAKKNNISLLNTTNFSSITGLGVKGIINNKEYIIGNSKFIKDELKLSIQDMNIQDSTNVILASERIEGIIYLSDEIKESAKIALEKIKSLGIQTVIATGDNRLATLKVNNIVNADIIHSELLPEQKLSIIKDYQRDNKLIAMVGDGINDSAAISQANVGIAVGAGTDIAKEAANVILQKNDLIDVYNAVYISKKKLIKIKQKLFWALIYNSIALLLTTGLYYVITGEPFNPMFGALAMSLSSISVVTNALRLRKIKLMNIVKNEENIVMKKVLIIEGMMCPMCEKHVKNALEALEGVTAIANKDTKEAVVTLSKEVSNETLKTAVEAAGYKVLEVK